MKIKDILPNEVYNIDDVDPKATYAVGMVVNDVLILCDPRSIKSILETKQVYSKVTAFLCFWETEIFGDAHRHQQGYVMTAFEDDVFEDDIIDSLDIPFIAEGS